ncbi:MAG: YdcF family protein [Burkholderiales bacterium]|nr:YdcF family protein [Burkholderiales bacterium]
MFKHLVLPPIALGWLIVIAWFQVRRRPALARVLLAAFMACVYLLALPRVSLALLRMTEAAVIDAQFVGAQAVVILAGGKVLEYDRQDRVVNASPNSFTLERLHEGARIARATGLPVLVTGGSTDGELPTEAEIMRRVLVRDYSITPRWVEERSRNTIENAVLSAPLLKREGVRRVILVTHAFHMRRSAWLFADSGLEVLPAPVRPVTTRSETSFGDYLPTAQSLLRSYYAFNEMAGLAGARLRAAWATP